MSFPKVQYARVPSAEEGIIQDHSEASTMAGQQIDSDSVKGQVEYQEDLEASQTRTTTTTDKDDETVMERVEVTEEDVCTSLCAVLADGSNTG